MVLIWVANLPKVRFCYRVVVGILGRTSVPILNLSTPPRGISARTLNLKASENNGLGTLRFELATVIVRQWNAESRRGAGVYFHGFL